MVYLAPLKSTVLEAKRRRERAASSAAAQQSRERPQSAYLQTVSTVVAHYANVAKGVDSDLRREQNDIPRSAAGVPIMPRQRYSPPTSSSSTHSRHSTGRVGESTSLPPSGKHLIYYNEPSSQFSTHNATPYSPSRRNEDPTTRMMAMSATVSPVMGAPNSRGSVSVSGAGASPPRRPSTASTRVTILDRIRDQVVEEGATTMELLTATIREQQQRMRHHKQQRSGGGAAAAVVQPNPMVGCMVENTVNESMRSVAEQCASVGLDVSSVAIADQFTTFASRNALMDALMKEQQGRGADGTGMSLEDMHVGDDPNEPNVEMWKSQLSRGFTYKGFDIASRHPAAIIFPALEKDLGTAGVATRSRLDVHVRCMLLGTVVVPQSVLGKKRPSDPTFSTISTITPEAEFKQTQRRQMRERLHREREVHSMSRMLGHGGGTADDGAYSPFTVERRSEEDLLQELFLTSRRSRTLSEDCINVMKQKIADHAVPLRPMREIHHLQLPGFVAYSDCGFIPEQLIVYEVPCADPDQPLRSSLDSGNIQTCRTSFYDDRFGFSSLEYTGRWCVPICAIKQQLRKDCWIRKQFTFPQQDPSAPPTPLGALLQRCGRGCVSIDITERATSDHNRRVSALASRPSSAYLRTFASGETPMERKGSPQGEAANTDGNVLYRHSFMFAERVTAALMKDRRYGRSRRKSAQ